MRYFKMNGCGNDFVIIDARTRGGLPLTAGAGQGHRRPGYRRRLRSGDRGRALDPGRRVHAHLEP